MKKNTDINRREFMVTTGAALAGAGLLTSGGSVMAQGGPQKKKRLALAGTSGRAKEF